MANEQLRFSPARAYWRQREVLASRKKRILALSHAVDQKTDLWPYQWAQLIAATLEFRPDLVLELGRGRGNSTAAFTEAANLLRKEGHNCTVVSLCFSDDWDDITKPRIKKVVEKEWFEPLKPLLADILDFDYESLLSGVKSCLIFWDAHGFEIAECVLGCILPKIGRRPHLVIMHDLSDTRYQSKDTHRYGDQPLWKGNNWSGPRLRIGSIDSAVEQSIAALDFTTRNEIPFDSADHSFHTEFESSPQKLSEMKKLLGADLFSLQGHWFWFTLNDVKGHATYPKYVPRQSAEPATSDLVAQVKEPEPVRSSRRGILGRLFP